MPFRLFGVCWEGRSNICWSSRMENVKSCLLFPQKEIVHSSSGNIIPSPLRPYPVPNSLSPPLPPNYRFKKAEDLTTTKHESIHEETTSSFCLRHGEQNTICSAWVVGNDRTDHGIKRRESGVSHEPRWSVKEVAYSYYNSRPIKQGSSRTHPSVHTITDSVLAVRLRVLRLKPA